MKEARVSETDVLPELKQIVGAMLFAAKGAVAAADVRRCLQQVAEERGGAYRDFIEVSERDVLAAIEELRAQVREARIGVNIHEGASGFRMENDANCGPWLRAFLQKGRANRLSRPALETLAVIAYRQPCTRAEIEAVRGVAVDQILRNLIDLQLVRITGRSDLPGRPWLFGTTQKFLDYFGLKDVKELPGIDELRRMEAEQEAGKAAAQPPQESALVEVDSGSAAESGGGEGGGEGETEGESEADSDSDSDFEDEDEDEYDDEDGEDDAGDEDEDDDDQKT